MTTGLVLFALATALMLATNYALYLDVKHDRETGIAGQMGQSAMLNADPFGDSTSFVTVAASQTLLALFLIGAGSFVFLRANRSISRQLATTARHLDNAQRLAGTGYWEFDIASQKLWWSGGMYRMLGIEPGDVKDCLAAYLGAIHPDDRARLGAAVSKIIDDRQPLSIRHRSILTDGAEITIRLQLEVATNEKGDVHLICGTGRDVTEECRTEDALRAAHAETEARVQERATALTRELAERQRTESALIESNYQLETLTRISAVGLFKSDETGFLTYTNESLCEIFGLDRAEALGTGWLSKLHPDDAQRVETKWRAAARAGKSHETEYRVIANGVERWIYAQARLECDENGVTTNYVGTITDITERKLAEDTIKRSEERLRMILDTAADGIIAMSPQCEITSFNAAAEDIFGYQASEVVGQNIKILMPGPYRTDHDSYVVSYLAGGEGKVINSGRNVQGQRKDGSIFPLYLAVSASSNERSAVFTGTVRDITDAVEAERQLLEARDQAENANLAKSEFLSRMSHELRTPMNAVLGFAQLLELQSAEPLTANQKQFVEQILGSGRHLLALIDEILDLSKIEAGGLVIEIENVSAADTVRESLGLLGPSAAARGIELIDQLKGVDLPTVHANATRLKQVIINLLSNAIKYNVEGGRVTVSSELLGQKRLRISVQDTGPGIPLERQSELFQPFARLGAEYSEIEGSGIGLSITKNLVELMGGEIHVDSHPGSGSTFSVDLKITPPATESPVAALNARASDCTDEIRAKPDHLIIF